MGAGMLIQLVVSAAPLAQHAPRIAAELVADGWQVSVTTSTNAAEWVDAKAVNTATGSVPTRPRQPGEPRTRERPQAVLLIPATFNTLNKLRQGISDTPALGVLNDAVGTGTPLLVVPMISERLVGHPAWKETCDWLGAAGVTIMDPTTGLLDELSPLVSGTGDDIADQFDIGAVLRWLKELR